MDARGGNDLLTVFASGHRLNKYSIKQKIDVQTLFFNFYADIPTETRFTPYLSAGLGMAFVSSKSSYTERSSGYNSYGPVSWDRLEDSGSSSSKRTTNFAWNAGAGLGIALVDNLTLDLAYRFAFLGEVKSKDITTNEATVQSKAQNLYMHQVMMGLRWEF